MNLKKQSCYNVTMKEYTIRANRNYREKNKEQLNEASRKRYVECVEYRENNLRRTQMRNNYLSACRTLYRISPEIFL
jgi:hypothetical protein